MGPDRRVFARSANKLADHVGPRIGQIKAVVQFVAQFATVGHALVGLVGSAAEISFWFLALAGVMTAYSVSTTCAVFETRARNKPTADSLKGSLPAGALALGVRGGAWPWRRAVAAAFFPAFEELLHQSAATIRPASQSP